MEQLPAGYRHAMTALTLAEAGARGPDDEHVHASTFALWAVTLDETFINVAGKGYARTRPGSLDGLRFVRNALSHGVIPGTQEAGLSIPFTLPTVIPPATWRHRADIEADWPSKRDHDHMGRAFEVELDGRPVVDCMAPILEHFRSWGTERPPRS